MQRITEGLSRLLVVLVSVAASLPVQAALPQRTFVASNGSDANPCSLALPCRGFATAVSAVVAGGEVVVLDSAGYGPVTVTQSVSIVAPPGIYAGISVPAGGNATGVFIATPGVKVVLRGLTINNIGGSYGVQMTDGLELVVENCVISNFGSGVRITAPAVVSVIGSTLRDNNYGIYAGYGATVNVAHSQVLGNVQEGIEINGGSGGVTTRIQVADTLVTGQGPGGFSYCLDNFANSGTTGHMSAIRVTVTNCEFAVSNEPSGSGTLTIGNSQIFGNGTAFDSFGTSFFSLGNNQLSNNAFDASGTITTVGGK